VFVKICGITRPADAAAAVDADIDAIGLNFVPKSRRCIDTVVARTLLAAVSDHVMTVGSFWDHSVHEVLEITGALGLHGAQLHGEHSREYTALVAARVETVITVVAATSPSVESIAEPETDVVMLDGAVPGGGVPFDWGSVGDLVTKHKILLAGGLEPGNVAEAVRRVRPWGVDVASGVEIEPGLKNPAAIAQFVSEARAASQEAWDS